MAMKAVIAYQLRGGELIRDKVLSSTFYLCYYAFSHLFVCLQNMKQFEHRIETY